MEENSNSNSKLFTGLQIHLGTFLCGPLAAGILISKNYKSLKEPELARTILTISISFTLIIVIFFKFTPNSLLDNLPIELFPVFFLVLEFFLFNYFIKDKIQKRLNEGSSKQSWSRAIGFSILGSIILYTGIILAFLSKPPYDGEKITFGNPVNTIYYDSEISQNDILRIKYILEEFGYYNARVQSIIQIRKESDNVYNVYFPMDEKLWNDIEILKAYKNIGLILGDLMRGNKFNIGFYFSNLSKTQYKKI